MPRRALITGITGQDGSFLAELLLQQGYEVHGLVRRVAIADEERRFWRIRHIRDSVHLHGASLEAYPSLCRALSSVQPDEVYHLAAQSFVGYSFADEFSTLATNVNGTHYMLAAFRDIIPTARFYFAASSEMFGNASTSPQNEDTPLRPRSIYGISKVTGYQLAVNYREAHGLYVASGILFNHESPRRGTEFVTRKISSHAAQISLGLRNELKLGNLDAVRDWGHAEDYVKGIWFMLQQDRPRDFVIASGEAHSIRDFLEIAFGRVGLDFRDYVRVDPDLYRPAEINALVGDASKAINELGWSYSKSFRDLVEEMVDADLAYYGSVMASGNDKHGEGPA